MKYTLTSTISRNVNSTYFLQYLYDGKENVNFMFLKKERDSSQKLNDFTKLGAKRDLQKKLNERTRNWCFIAYPDSAPDGWIENLRNEGIPFIISPLHDADFNADDTQKKPHWHVILNFKGLKSYSQILKITLSCNGTAPKMVADLQSYCRYLIHKDNPEKAQYNPEDVIVNGGFDYLTFISSSSDILETIVEMQDFVQSTGIDSFMAFSAYCRENNRQWFKVLTMHSTYFFDRLLKSSRFENIQNRKKSS